MAHLVENMAYVGQTPWHGLGRQLDAGRPIDDWVIQAGMDWEIQESPVRFITGQRVSMMLALGVFSVIKRLIYARA